MVEILLPVALAFIMFSLGLGLERRQFLRVARRPGALAAGLVAQVLLLPLTAFLIAGQLALEPVHAAGLMILAACPGGATAGLLTRLANGETALSISLSALTAMLAFVSVPLVVGFGLHYFLGQTDVAVALPMGQLIGGLVLVTLLPVALGVWLRESGRISKGLEQRVHRVSTGLFLLMVLYTFTSNWDVITAVMARLGPACLLLNLICMGNGVVLGAAVRLDRPGRVALAMECGIQNAALGMTLALSVLGEPALAVASVTYALLMNLTAFAVIGWRRLREKRLVTTTS